jgi:hypothetical protein
MNDFRTPIGGMTDALALRAIRQAAVELTTACPGA